MQYRIKLDGSNETLGKLGTEQQRDTPGRRLADSYPWPGEVLSQPLIVLREAAELELGHGLFVGTRVHGWSKCAGTQLPREFRAKGKGKRKGRKGATKTTESGACGCAGGRKGLDAVLGDEEGQRGSDDGGAERRTHGPVEDQRRDGEGRRVAQAEFLAQALSSSDRLSSHGRAALR